MKKETILPFFVALPIILTDKVSFIDKDVDFIWMQNIINIFRPPISEEFIPAVIRSAVFTVINYGMVWLFGMTLALLMYELTSRVRRGFFTVIYMPYIVYRYSFHTALQGSTGTLAGGMTMSITVYFPLFVIAYFLTQLQKRLQY